ncbi:MAG: hypothetical protein NTW14_09990 [bacterium]|nr:hypothetical protein [bacterium]
MQNRKQIVGVVFLILGISSFFSGTVLLTPIPAAAMTVIGIALLVAGKKKTR